MALAEIRRKIEAMKTLSSSWDALEDFQGIRNETIDEILEVIDKRQSDLGATSASKNGDGIILVDEEEILAAELADPKDRAEWEAAAPERALANITIAIRAKQGLTQKELAEKLGLAEAQISRLESGDR